MDLAQQRTGHAVAAVVVGNVLEWYDFVVYSYFATIIAKNFFPATDELAALLATFAAFGVGFFARPLGGIVIGRIGDRKGRKTALILTLMLMAAGTVLIGLAPTLCEYWGSCPGRIGAGAADARLLRRRRVGQFDRLYRRIGAGGAARPLWQLATMQRGRGPTVGFRHRGVAQYRVRFRRDGELGHGTDQR